MGDITKSTHAKYAKILLKIFEIIKNKYNLTVNKEDIFKIKFMKEYYIKEDLEKKMIVIFIPLKSLKKFRRIQYFFIKEFESYIPNTYLSVLSIRTIKPLKYQKISKTGSYSWSFTNVADDIIRDMLFPGNIVGKRIFFFSNEDVFIQIYLEDKYKNFNNSKINLVTRSLHSLIHKKIHIVLTS